MAASLSPAIVFAAQTLAGTIISNQAQLSYSVDSIAQTPTTSNLASFSVLELINVSLIWQDAANVRVNTPQQNAPLTFVLSNTGNGSQSYHLIRNNTVAGDQFDPPNASQGSIYLENGLQAGLQTTGPNADVVYITGINYPSLSAGESQTVYVVSAIPSGLALGSLGLVNLRAESRTLGVPGSPPGSSHPNITALGQTSTAQAITGLTQGQSVSVGGYLIDGVVVLLKKTIVSPNDANSLIPGTQLHYRLTVDVQGVGSVQNLIINDPLPAQLNYISNSITVDGVAKTDALDVDNTQFANNTVTVNLGNLTAPASVVIEFRTTLQ